MVALVAVILVVLTATRWVDVANTTLAAVQSLRWVYGLIGLLVLVAAVTVRRAVAVVSALVLVGLHATLGAPWFIGSPAADGKPPDVTVMASNLQFGRGDQTRLAAAVAELGVDVLVLTEVTPEAERELALPHHVGRGAQHAAGTMALSRWPVSTVSPGTDTTFHQPVVRVATPSGPLRVQAVHVAPPTSALRWHTELSQLLTATLAVRDAQAEPLVLAGDFNATDDHPVLRRLTEVTVDAHRDAGAGWVRSWPTQGAVPAFAGIDHVLLRGPQVVDAGTLTLPGSDHAVVWAQLVIA
jgi:endonuclease/exonuclease/phosphatase (EEP) superfamily protein YafD